MNIKKASPLLLLLLVLNPIAALASNSWQVTIDSSRLKHYLDYPSSSLKAVLKLSVSFKRDDDDSRFQYETFYYSDGVPIGLNKHCHLALAPGSVGTIQVVAAPDSVMPVDESDAVANAAGRLFLDLYSNHCAVYHVIVPAISFDAMVAGFGRNGFHAQLPNNSPSAVLNVMSDPPGKFQAMAF
jgi:hypothetical protein